MNLSHPDIYILPYFYELLAPSLGSHARALTCSRQKRPIIPHQFNFHPFRSLAFHVGEAPPYVLPALTLGLHVDGRVT